MPSGDGGGSGGGKMFGWENPDKVLSNTFANGKCSTNSEKGLREYNLFRCTSEDRKSIQCLLNLLQIDFP